MHPALPRTAVIVGALLATHVCAAAPTDSYRAAATSTAPYLPRNGYTGDLTLLGPMTGPVKNNGRIVLAPKSGTTPKEQAELLRIAREIERNPADFRFATPARTMPLNLLSTPTQIETIEFRSARTGPLKDFHP